MPLTNLQKQRIAGFIPIFRKYMAATDRIDDIQIRQERITLFTELLSPDDIVQMTELEFGKVVGSLWSFAMWGNKGYLVSKLLEDNPLDHIKTNLQALLWGPEPLAERYDRFRRNSRGFGPASITELLSFTHPDDCGLLNDKAKKALKLLGFSDTFPYLNTYQIDGLQYTAFNALLQEIKEEIRQYNLGEMDLLGIDYFLFEVWSIGIEEQETATTTITDEQRTDITDFDHDGAIEQLMTIGQWLGFEVEKEKIISVGARVDAIWQARVANLGVVTYVFEVQRRGGVDSLILNLQRAQNNPTVQRLIVVGLEGELNRVRNEINTLREEFRRMVGYMEVTELMRASDLVVELSGIINKLELVKSEFGG